MSLFADPARPKNHLSCADPARQKNHPSCAGPARSVRKITPDVPALGTGLGPSPGPSRPLPHALSYHPANQKTSAFYTYVYRALNIYSDSSLLKKRS